MNINLHGFGFIRNAIKYDYPFQESFQSLKNLCQTTYILAGDSEDETTSLLKKISGIQIGESVWDPKLRQGGLILSEQTNLALSNLKNSLPNLENAWGFYLQADEVLLEKEYAQILQDFDLAERGGFDAISFRYLHFWQNHQQIAINKKWYPHEIRAIKLDSKIESWGDAQSFRGQKKVYFSNAHIFHYGHVRKIQEYQDKKRDILKLYHHDEKLKKYQKREQRYDAQTLCLPYLGYHPELMKERILKIDGPKLNTLPAECVRIIDRQQFFRDEDVLIQAIDANEVQLLRHFQWRRKSIDIVVGPNWWERLRYQNFTPTKMKNKKSEPFTLPFQLILELSRHGVGLKV